MTDPNISTHWYKGNITRDQAVDYLKQTQLSDIAPNFADQNVFLVRWSPKFEKPNTDKPKYSQYVLSVRFNDETLKHYRIFYHNRPLPGYEEHQVGFYIETSTNHSSGFDYIGNPDILCENLENGKIELEKSSVVNDINGNVSIERKPYKCFPILNNNYWGSLREVSGHKVRFKIRFIIFRNLAKTWKTHPLVMTLPTRTNLNKTNISKLLSQLLEPTVRPPPPSSPVNL